MNDWTIRLGIAGIAGLTYFGGAIPSNMHFADIGQLPMQTWIYFAINILSGIYSPSLLKATGKVTGLIK